MTMLISLPAATAFNYGETIDKAIDKPVGNRILLKALGTMVTECVDTGERTGFTWNSLTADQLCDGGNPEVGDLEVGGGGGGDDGNSGPCGQLLVCAHVTVAARVIQCLDGTVCWTATAGGFHVGKLGLVTGNLDGGANGVPFHDLCVSPGISTYCETGAGAHQYPGPSVFAWAAATTTAPYGMHADYDTDSA